MAQPIVIRASSRPQGPPRREPIKRLILACDGTWLNSDNTKLNGELAIPSNVTRITRAIKPESSDGTQQVVFYQEGIATMGGIFTRVVGGAIGAGVQENVREGYSFLCNNYHPGDEIILLGFSRGAFTARSIAGLIAIIGLLTKKALNYLPEIHRDVRNRRKRDYKPKNPDIPFSNKPSANDPAYALELERARMTWLNVSIKAIGVWDTVGTLGVPRVGLLNHLPIQMDDSTHFEDTKLGNHIENAFQALALDEERTNFAPSLWEKPPGCTTTLRQVWFPGVHSNIGGGYQDSQLANITLAWMMSQLAPLLSLNYDYILREESSNAAYYRSTRQKIRPWSFGRIYDSLSGLYNLGGGTARTPGTYYATDPRDLNPTERPLRNTCEYIHPSVRTRLRLGGPGMEDEGVYGPEALKDWRLVVEYPNDDPDHGDPDIYWRARFPEKRVSTRVLPETPLWDVERRLLSRDPEMMDYVMFPPPTKKRGERPVSLSGPASGRDERRGGRREGGASDYGINRERDRDRERRRSEPPPSSYQEWMDQQRQQQQQQPQRPRYSDRDRPERYYANLE
ncbi:hypothetical protein M501DRAFT_925408 [Patellaria atrata CBS 101060]|uniref:T6SS Phospholipase effector Tle1-like catalytic domain-containing protein n=1 Tax=Patellaria atrata CBS 101060 TaxID=1346257 RepID=A0A9P4VVS5_9PEZI|nr:hypothetical protein M501DRAFT_925408 [Patellaria atrata CBS 101060]